MADCLIKHRLYGNIKIHRNVYTFVNTFQGGETDGRDARKTKKETPPGRSPAFAKLPTDLQLVSCETQADLKRVTGARSILLDAYGTDSTGKKYDIEVQRADIGAGQDFSKLPDTYVIFITENDYYGEKQPLYSVQNIITTTGKPFDDGTHILYVNGEYRGDSEIGKLMHDFNCTQADDMIFPLMAEKTRYLKENPKGVSEVCKQMEDLRNESIFEGKILTLIDLVEDGTLTLDKAAAKAGMTVTQFKKEMEKVSLQIG